MRCPSACATHIMATLRSRAFSTQVLAVSVYGNFTISTQVSFLPSKLSKLPSGLKRRVRLTNISAGNCGQPGWHPGLKLHNLRKMPRKSKNLKSRTLRKMSASEVVIEMQDTGWDEEGVLLFSPFRIVNRRRTAAGTRRTPYNSACGIDSVLVRGFCRLPRFMAAPGPVKSAIKNSPGNQQENNRIDAGGYLVK